MAFYRFPKIILFCTLVLVCFSCADRYEPINTQVIIPDQVSRADDTLMYDSLAHVPFSRLRRLASFGLRYAYELPEQNRGKEMYVVVSGRTRSNYAQSTAVIVVVTHKDNEQLSWQVIPMRLYYTEQNKWCTFRDSVRVPEKFDWKEYTRLDVVTHLSNSTQELFDIDTMKVVLKQKQY